MPISVTMMHKCGFFCTLVLDALGLSDVSRVDLLRRGEGDALLDLLCFLVSERFKNPDPLSGDTSASCSATGCCSNGGGAEITPDSELRIVSVSA